MPISAKVVSLFHRSLPILSWIPVYQRVWLLSDVFAGLALWAVMVPEGMAYAGIVGVPPIMGLYTIVPVLIAYALLGTSSILGKMLQTLKEIATNVAHVSMIYNPDNPLGAPLCPCV
jgi:MFS superfamily sulfate permease-like transporter